MCDLVAQPKGLSQILNNLRGSRAWPSPQRTNVCQTNGIRQQRLHIFWVGSVESVRLTANERIVNGPDAERTRRRAHCQGRLAHQLLDVGFPCGHGNHHDGAIDGIQLWLWWSRSNVQQRMRIVKFIRIPQ